MSEIENGLCAPCRVPPRPPPPPPCPWGCGQGVYPDQISEHTPQCPFGTKKCPLGCDKMWLQPFNEKQITKHVKENCPCRIVPCPLGCGAAGIMAADIEEHQLKTCPFRIVPCRYRCGIQDLQYRHKETHETEQCPLRPAICSLGCGHTRLTHSNREAHETKECPLRLVHCSVEECPVEMQARYLQKHVEGTLSVCQPCSPGPCPYSPQACKLKCAAPLRRIDMENHVRNDCPNRIINCPYGCGAGGTIFQTRACEMEHHRIYECPMRPIPCEWARCWKEIPAMHLKEHMQDCPYKPMPPVQPFFNGTRKHHHRISA